MVSTSPRSGAKKARKRYSWCRYDVQVITLVRCYLVFDMTSYSTAGEPNEIDNVMYILQIRLEGFQRAISKVSNFEHSLLFNPERLAAQQI